MCESLILHKVKYYDIKGKKSLLTKSKYYADDLGLLSSVVSYQIKDNMFSYRLENLIFLELISRGYDVYTYEDRYGREVDFVAIKNNKITYYQITFDINDDDYKRESRSLLSLKDGYEKIILTLGHNIPITEDGIKIMHIFN
jgi:predicted AAA+ superfamily ATPase